MVAGEERPRLLFSSKKLVMSAVWSGEGAKEAPSIQKLSVLVEGGALTGVGVAVRDFKIGGEEICGAKVVLSGCDKRVGFPLRGARGCKPLEFFRLPVIELPSTTSSLLFAGFKASHRLVATTADAFFPLVLCSDLRLRVAVVAVRCV